LGRACHDVFNSALGAVEQRLFFRCQGDLLDPLLRQRVLAESNGHRRIDRLLI
jgi:hypothetical protein